MAAIQLELFPKVVVTTGNSGWAAGPIWLASTRMIRAVIPAVRFGMTSSDHPSQAASSAAGMQARILEHHAPTPTLALA